MVIKNLPKNSAIIFREYDLNRVAREKMAREVFDICRKNNQRILIGKDYELAQTLGADGVHFSDRQEFPAQINRQQNFMITLACHNFSSVLKSQNLPVDAIFLSPIFPTKSHEGAPVLGLEILKKAMNTSKIPIFALGGVNEENLKILQSLGAQGFGGIDIFITGLPLSKAQQSS